MRQIIFPIFFILINSTLLYATSSDQLAGASDELSHDKFGQHQVERDVQHDMELNCRNGLCTIIAIDSVGNEISTSLNLGKGEAAGAPADASVANLINVGVTVTYTHKICTQRILIPRSLYLALSAYFKSLVDASGNTRANFDPSQQAMLLFYQTMISQVHGCS